MLKPLIFLLALGLTPLAHAQASSYAGQQAREIKALSGQEVAGLLAGEGMGYAKAAELNGYPGPSHVLALAPQLLLSPRQEEASRKLLLAHKAAARRIGTEIVERERALDRAFAARMVDDATIRHLTAEIGSLQAGLRAEHLKTHLAQAALLDAAQVARYAERRGYGAGQRSGGSHGH